MSFQYSILKVALNQDLDDTISIGLLLLAQDRYWFKYSQDRLKYIKPIIGPGHDALIKLLKIITRKINTVEGFQLDLYNDLNEFFSEDFLKQLSNQHKGMLRFSKPEPIVLTSINTKVFDGLFKSIIGEESRKKRRKTNPEKATVERKLIKPLIKKVHTHIKLDGNNISDLYFRYDLEAIGKNGDVYLAKYLDFSLTPPTLEMKIMRLLFLNRLIRQSYRTKTRVFAVATEPAMREPKKHKLYEFIARHEDLEVKAPDECPQIVGLFTQAEMRKFL